MFPLTMVRNCYGRHNEQQTGLNYVTTAESTVRGSHVSASQEENGGAGVYSADLRKHYMLENPSWKRDIMPEIIEGKNVLDYVDPDIEAKLEALEMEEEALAAAAAIEVCLLSMWQGLCITDVRA